MRVVIPTVQHTGTKFVRNMFKGWHQASFIEPPEGDTVHVGHISAGQISNIRVLLNSGLPAIIPLRHPHLVYESWVRRKKDPAELIENWKLLDGLREFNPYFLHIDTCNRFYDLEKINRDLGLDLKTDWAPVNSVSSTFNLNPEDVEVSEVYKDFINRRDGD